MTNETYYVRCHPDDYDDCLNNDELPATHSAGNAIGKSFSSCAGVMRLEARLQYGFALVSIHITAP